MARAPKAAQAPEVTTDGGGTTISPAEPPRPIEMAQPSVVTLINRGPHPLSLSLSGGKGFSEVAAGETVEFTVPAGGSLISFPSPTSHEAAE